MDVAMDVYGFCAEQLRRYVEAATEGYIAGLERLIELRVDFTANASFKGWTRRKRGRRPNPIGGGRAVALVSENRHLAPLHALHSRFAHHGSEQCYIRHCRP